ncbi:nucleotidyltransferase domain-containing protein [Candidatus Woesearchaeota archaeon]|nr:nucleotidyltransferase domain-containing protein [Candidatus Woesearchaeota archaeon]
MPIERMILFGSRADGTAKKDSDVDLIIVSPRFKLWDFFKRGAKMYDYWDVGYPADFLCYTPEEFNRLSKQITLVSEAIKKGIEL